MVDNKYNWVWYFEWISTIVLLIGCTLNAMNIYPANIYWCLAGNFGWAVVGFVWRKWSLIVIQAVVTVIYLYGIYNSW
jgi:hypothetical protein